MNLIQREVFLRALSSQGIRHRLSGDEVAISCPACSPYHHNKRLTFYLNLRTDASICFRCEPRRAGRGVNVALLALFGLEHLLHQFEGEVEDIQEGSLTELRRKLLLGPPATPEGAFNSISLPMGFRRDWLRTVSGRQVLAYLIKRGFNRQTLKATGVGYVIEGPLGGRVVFPVTIGGQLRFWQARAAFMASGPPYLGPEVDKRGVLYGYDLAGAEVIVVEGIFDVLGVGLGRSVALLGKTVSDTQIELLARKNVSKITVLLDGDAWSSCLTVARRLSEKLWTLTAPVEAWRLTSGIDPGAARGQVGKHVIARVTV